MQKEHSDLKKHEIMKILEQNQYDYKKARRLIKHNNNKFLEDIITPQKEIENTFQAIVQTNQI